MVLAAKLRSVGKHQEAEEVEGMLGRLQAAHELREMLQRQPGEASAMTPLRMSHLSSASPVRLDSSFEAVDTNHDGVIDREEFIASAVRNASPVPRRDPERAMPRQPAARPKRPEQPREWNEQWQRDSNGVLSINPAAGGMLKSFLSPEPVPSSTSPSETRTATPQPHQPSPAASSRSPPPATQLARSTLQPAAQPLMSYDLAAQDDGLLPASGEAADPELSPPKAVIGSAINELFNSLDRGSGRISFADLQRIKATRERIKQARHVSASPSAAVVAQMLAHNPAAASTVPVAPPVKPVSNQERVETGVGAVVLEGPPHIHSGSSPSRDQVAEALSTSQVVDAVAPPIDKEDLFDQIDTNGDGVIDRHEFIAAYSKMSLTASNNLPPPPSSAGPGGTNQPRAQMPPGAAGLPPPPSLSVVSQLDITNSPPPPPPPPKLGKGTVPPLRFN